MNKQDAVQWLGNRGHDIILSDIIRCKMLGNGFTVDVISHILKHI